MAQVEPFGPLSEALRHAGRSDRELDELRFKTTFLESQIEASPVGILMVDPGGRMLTFNRRFIEMWDIPGEVVESRSDEGAIASVLDRLVDPDGFLARIRYLYDHPEEESEDELLLKDGRIFGRHSAPVRGTDGAHFGRVWYFRDVTARRQQERRLAAQYAVVSVLAESPSLDIAAPKILEALCSGIGWDWSALWTVDRSAGVLRCLEVWHSPARKAPEFERAVREATFSLGVGLPGRVWESGAPAWVSDFGADDHSPPATSVQSAGLRSAVGFPVRVGSEILGVIEAFHADALEEDEDLMQMAAAIGSQVGQFIVRKRAEDERRDLLARERAARAEAEAAQRRLEFLANASLRVSVSLDYRKTLEALVDLAVPYLADWCFVDVLEQPDTTHRVALAYADPSKAELAQEMRTPSPDPETKYGVNEVLRTGRPIVVTEVTDEIVREISGGGKRLETLREMRPESYMIIPLTARDRTLGAMVLVSAGSGRVYTDDDKALAEELAARAAISIDNARLYQERHHVAQTLQRSLLPPLLPSIPGVDIGARYEPTGGDNEVGGDFYDVFRTGRKRWAIVIGDVCGKGADAAAMTGLARYTLRTAAMQRRQPRLILRLLNEMLLEEGSDERFCTVCLGILQPEPGGATLTFSTGGHPLPLVLRSDGKVEHPGTPGTLLGLLDEVDLDDRVVDLKTGDLVLFYTDGVVDAEGPNGELGLSGLVDALKGCAGRNAAEVAAAIGDAVLERSQYEPSDDLALLVVKISEPDAPDTTEGLWIRSSS